MPRYMIKVSYSAGSVAAMLKNPTNRRDAAEQLARQIGGKLESFYFAFGEDDVYATFEAPDNVSAAALSLTVGASGGMSKVSTVVLMTPEEGLEAMRKAGQLQYSPPS